MITEKSLVLYKGQCALVAESSDKLSIVLSGGERIRVREKDVELLHGGPAQSVDAVVSAPTPEGDPEAARELLQGESVPLAELAELAYGSWTPRTAWAAWQLVADGLLFRGTPQAIQARTDEEVESERVKRREKENEAADREAFLGRLASGGLLPDDLRRLQDVEALAYGKSDRSKTMRDAGIKESPEEAHKLLLRLGVWDELVNPHPTRYGRDLFSARIEIVAPPPEEREDLTAFVSYAIDNEWSSDPDDAIAVVGDELWVHVADPAAAIECDSPADLEARGRGETLYLPEGTFRMVADGALDDYALGLAPTSPALSFGITLAADGSIAAVRILRSTVRVQRLSYEEADRRADEPELASIFATAERLLERRSAEGAVHIDLPEVHISVADREIRIESVLQTKASAAVREFMLIAGQASARFAMRSRLPFPFVSQEIGDLPAETAPGLAGSYQLRRCMRPRRLSAAPGAHEGLGLPEYCQVTSPLRRYTDLVAHQQLRRFISGREPLTQDQVLERIAAGEAAAQSAVQAERASRLHWTLAYLMSRREERWDAVVVERKGNRGTVLIPALGLETNLALKEDPGLNDIVQVVLRTVKLPTLEYSFAQA